MSALLVGDAEVFHKHNRFAIAKNILHSLHKVLDTHPDHPLISSHQQRNTTKEKSE
jgi:hypothetical protein